MYTLNYKCGNHIKTLKQREVPFMFNNKNIQDSYFLKIEEMEFLFMNSRGFWL